MSNDKESIVYTTMDDLFDTRLGIYTELDDRLVDNYFSSDVTESNLYLRSIVFNKIYDRRDKKTLHNSKHSNVILLLRKISSDITLHNSQENKNMRLKLVVNHYPYDLTSEEKKLIKVFFIKNIIGLSDLEFTYESMEDMPSNKFSRVSLLITRYGVDWIMRRLKKDNDFKISSVRLITSNIIESNVEIKKASTDIKKIENYIFTMLSPYVTIELIEDEVFKCMI